MGQYYKAVILDKNRKTPKGFLSPWSLNNGAKLMEHSWLGNNLVSIFEKLLTPDGLFYKSPVVWAGDYADEDKGLKTNVYQRCADNLELKESTKLTASFKYIVNHDKKEFVNKTKVPVSSTYDYVDEKTKKNKKVTYRIHPLPLLTCEGNGRGGGDFNGDNELVGSWARNIISIEKEIPTGYKEIKFGLVER